MTVFLVEFSDHGSNGQKWNVVRLCFACRGKGGLHHASAIPHPSHAQFGKWVDKAWQAISDDELHSAMRKAIFPNGPKLSQLEDVDFPEHHAANAKPDSDSDSDDDSGTNSDSELLTSDDSLSCSDFGEDDEVQIVWAKAGRGIWGLGHVFEGKLYCTKDIVDDSFVPRNRKPKTIPNLKPSLLQSLPQSLPQRASLCNCSR